MKLLNNFSNNKPHDTNGFKKEVKMKHNSLKAIAEKFPNGTASMMALLTVEAIPLNLVAYCALTPDKPFTWEERGNELNKAMLYLMNSKNKHAKKNLRLVYSQGNMTAYPSNIETMSRYLYTQYPNNKPTNQRNGEMGDKNKGDGPKSEERTVTRVTL